MRSRAPRADSIDPSKIPALDRFVAELFDEIREGDQALTDVEPLAHE